MNIIRKQKAWLLPAVLILFILEVLTLPLVVSLTYAGRSENPEHILTYTTNSLTWDANTKVRADGTGEMTLFDTVYQNVESSEADVSVLAPGTEGDNIIRLRNACGNDISYTAVLYMIRSSDLLPVKASFNGSGEQTESYTLPEGVWRNDVIRALHGTLGKDEIADFDIDWSWTYYEDEAQDVIDTLLGDNAAYGEAEDVVVGFYIVVEDDGTIIPPQPPQTGENTVLYGYVALVAISLALLILLFLGRRKKDATE